MNEDKAYATITTIFSRIARDFPLISSIQNIAKRLSNEIRDRIKDVFQYFIQRCEPTKEKKKSTGLKSFMEGIKDDNLTITKTFS